MNFSKYLSTLLIMVTMGPQAWSQVSVERWVIGSVGGSYNSGTLNLDYTMGESVISTVTAAGATLTQGFHQPGNLAVSINENSSPDLLITVFPNPAVDQLNITISNIQEGRATLELLNIVGQRLEVRALEPVAGQPLHCVFEMQQYATGTYFLRIQSGKKVQVIKVAKISQ